MLELCSLIALLDVVIVVFSRTADVSPLRYECVFSFVLIHLNLAKSRISQLLKEVKLTHCLAHKLLASVLSLLVSHWCLARNL